MYTVNTDDLNDRIEDIVDSLKYLDKRIDNLSRTLKILDDRVELLELVKKC